MRGIGVFLKLSVDGLQINMQTLADSYFAYEVTGKFPIVTCKAIKSVWSKNLNTK
jgi:hypothetical protein